MEKGRTDLMSRAKPSAKEQAEAEFRDEVAAQYNFENLRFPVHRYPLDTELLIKFPELQQYKEIQQYTGIDRNKMIRYMCFMYDQKSLLNQYFPDIDQRRLVCLRLAGYLSPTETLEDNRRAKEVALLLDPQVAAVAKMFVKMQKSRVFKLKLVIEQVHEENMAMLLDPLFVAPEEAVGEEGKPKKPSRNSSRKPKVDPLTAKLNTAQSKAKLITICNQTIGTLDELDRKLYGEDEVLQVAVETVVEEEKKQEEEAKQAKEKVKKKIRPISPETMAEYFKS